ncbi:uncharacterized protein LOC135366524 isoform X2 [Ornithodoros turicata]|uniref:uncharacterized protein LOC135366524 isoform X2 n=1 Tax=Ornithodoros turicata TaxID=34597 RepID=UPI003138D864
MLLTRRRRVMTSPKKHGKRQRQRGTQYCCVVGCHKSLANVKGCAPQIKFYRFPGKAWETERRKAWIAAVRRKNDDGSDWVPNSSSRICSTHFVANCKSSIQTHPSYVPSIFHPPPYQKKAPNEERHRRWKKRLEAAVACSPCTVERASMTEVQEAGEDVPRLHDADDSGLLILAEVAVEAANVEPQTADQGTQTEVCFCGGNSLPFPSPSACGQSKCTQATQPADKKT